MRILACLSLLVASSSQAWMRPQVSIEGTVGDFDQKTVELSLADGVKIAAPRADFGGENLRPGLTATMQIAFDDLRTIVVQYKKKKQQKSATLIPERDIASDH